MVCEVCGKERSFAIVIDDDEDGGGGGRGGGSSGSGGSFSPFDRKPKVVSPPPPFWSAAVALEAKPNEGGAAAADDDDDDDDEAVAVVPAPPTPPRAVVDLASSPLPSPPVLLPFPTATLPVLPPPYEHVHTDALAAMFWDSVQSALAPAAMDEQWMAVRSLVVASC